MKYILKFIAAAWLAFQLASCSPNTWKNINYLQDVQADTTMQMITNEGIIIQPQDQLSIIVSSGNPTMSALFNKTVATYYQGTEMGMTTNRLTGYVVDNDGFINFPQLGKIEVAGLNRWELQSLIEDKLSSEGLLRDANVTVEFLNFKISVLGEVASPGTYTVAGDKITVFQALALARDLTIDGQRGNIKVIREKNGRRDIFNLDPRSSDIFNSPAYYLQQNDVIYVTPNSKRAGQSTINENYFKSGSFWMSAGSLAITVTNLIITLSAKNNSN